MLLSFDETSKMISGEKLLHIAETESLIKELPKGNWVGAQLSISCQKTPPKFQTNCFLYGGLEGKDIKIFFEPITFEEVACQLVNQILVHVTYRNFYK